MLGIERITKFSELKRLQPFWDDVLQKSEHNLVFLSFDFIEAEWENIGWELDEEKELSPFILVVKEQEEILGLLPFVKEWKRFYGLPVTMIRSLGHQYLDRSDMIISRKPREIMEKVFAYFEHEETSWNVLFFQNVAEGSFLITYAAAPHGSSHVMGCKPGYRSPCVKKRGTWTDYIRSRSKNYHKRLNNKTNGLIKHAGTIVAREYRAPEEVDLALSIAFDIDSKSWKAQEGTAISSTEKSRKYWQTLTKYLAERGRVRIWILWAGDRAIAFEYHVVYNKTVYSMKWSYDREYRRYSPGLLLKHRSMEAFWSEDIAEIHLLGTSDKFKEQWTDEKQIHYNLYLFNNTIYSRIVDFLVFRLRDLFLKFKKKASLSSE